MEEQNWNREVLESKRRLEGIVASAMDAIITIDETQTIILFNPAAEQMFGVSMEDALGQPISRFIPQRFRAGHGEHIKRFRNTGVTGRRMGALGAISGLRADGEEFPVEASISQVDVGDERLATVILRDITERIANEEARLLLAREVDHRAKNALAVVQALVSLTTAVTKEDFIKAVQGRVAALGRAHSLLAQSHWRGGDLRQIIDDETAAYHKPGQVRCQGPDIALAPSAVQPISLLIHELATNAVKYGAFSVPGGEVDITWRIDTESRLELRWIESGGPIVIAPEAKGFGSTLIMTVARQLGGRIDMAWEPIGLRVAASLPEANYRSNSLGGFSSADSEQTLGEMAGKAGRLLIVEDEMLVAMELASALASEGWDVIGPAATLEEAFQILGDADGLDIAILDINLNGQLVYPIADLLQTRGIPFLFCTGYERPHQVDRYPGCPVLRKPANLRQVNEELTRIAKYGPKPNGPPVTLEI
jgi:PAS domain S-box-containing protein